MFFRGWGLVAALLALAAGVPAGAAEAVLVLSNGDRLKGEVVSRTDDAITFRSPILGELVVPVDSARVLESADQESELGIGRSAAEDPEAVMETMVARAVDDPEERPAGPEPSAREPEPVAAATDGPRAEAGPAGPWLPGFGWLRWLVDHRPLKEWSHSLNFGYRMAQARDDRTDLNFRSESYRKLKGGEVRVTGRYDYSEVESPGVDPRTITDRVQGTLRGRRDLSKRTYLQLDSRYASDDLRQLDHDIEQSLGLGWRLIDRAPWRATITPAATGEWRSEAGVTDWSLQATVFQDLRYRISERVTFFQEADVSLSPTAGGDYQANLDMRLEAKLTSAVAVDLRYELDVDTALRTTTEESQSRILATLGLKF